MNKRRRDILASLAPAVEFARAQRPDVSRETVPGLAWHARVSAAAPAELMIYGPIGGSMWDGGISASDVAAVLREAGPGPIDVRLNSPGGDVFQGVAIHTLLARHAGTITMHVDGLAASAASFIMLAGDRIRMARNAMVMIHDGMTGSYGNAATLRRAADLLDKVSVSIADMYAERAGEDPEHWRGLMTVNAEDGTWFTGQEAYDAGLVDELTETPDEDEESQVWDRLANHVDILPEPIAARVRAHAEREEIEIPDAPDEDDSTDKDIEPDADGMTDGSRGGSPHEPEDECDNDFAHRMRMWAWMNQSGLLAGKDTV